MAPLFSKEGVVVARCSTLHAYPSSIEEGSYLHSRLYAQKVRRTTARRRVAIGTRPAQDAWRPQSFALRQPDLSGVRVGLDLPSSAPAEMRGRQAVPLRDHTGLFFFLLRLVQNHQVVSHGKDVRHLVGAHADDRVIHLVVDHSLQRHVAVIHDDVNRG
jgi:hypothetical protein